MSSQRRLIREDIVARLLGKTSVGQRVFASRSIPLPEEKLPAILVSIPRERGQNLAEGGPPRFRTTSTVIIQCVVKEIGAAEVEDTLDLLAEEVEQVLLTDPVFVKQFEKIANYDSQLMQITQGNIELASLAMQIDLQFDDLFPPVVADDFEGLRIKTDAIDPADPNIHPPDGTYPDGYGGQPGPDKRIEVEQEIELEIEP